VGSVKRFFLFLQDWRFGRSRSSKVIDFGTNPISPSSNFGPILHRFRDIAGFCVDDPTPNFGGVLVGPDRPCWG